MDHCNCHHRIAAFSFTRLKAVAIVTLLAALTGCSQGEPEAEPTEQSHAPGGLAAAADSRMQAPEKDIRPEVKRLVATAIAGNYNQYCNDLSGDGPVASPEQNIVISADGMLHSGAGNVDFVNATTTAVVLTVGRAEQMLSAGIDVHDPDTQDRTFVIGVHRLAETVGATVTNESQQPARSFGCSGPIPPAFAMDLWTPVFKQIHFDTVTANCTAIPLVDKGPVRVRVSDGQLKVNDQIFSAEQARSSEGIQVSDDGVVYSFTAADNTGYDLSVQPDGSFAMLSIHRNDEHLSCI